ncbi:hypothetical protein MLD38_006041 [Melastoma candidum]|uniref:Uncharacterized protein n=1 Tax=Melastoma candidum TaxID=119954 RepID=A0ACB9RM79_9MYRT|nr:hypothetical protein MLD38_006041 [Melastoma candidum]
MKEFVGRIAIFSLLGHFIGVSAASDVGFLTRGPSSAVIGAVLCLTFAVVFLVLIYLKYCHRIPDDPLGRVRYYALNGSGPPCSGFDRAVIDSLPIFKFSLLKGLKQGLECAVCMSKFQDLELLRLLPKCNHAFHTTCIDRWLENHPTCPLCRYKYEARELSVPDNSLIQSFLSRDSNSLRGTDVDIYIKREEILQRSPRFSLGDWSKFFDRIRKAEHLIEQVDKAHGNRNMLHRFNHKIVVRSLVIKERWSDLNSLDLLLLSSEMLSTSTSQLFTRVYDASKDRVNIMEDIEEGIGFGNSARPSNVSEGRRSVSEITGLSRFANRSGHGYPESPSIQIGESTGETRTGRLWLPIVHRTINRLAGRRNFDVERIAA